MATIGDGQIPRMNGSLIEYYDADIKTATDYYSYGMVMPGRTFNSGTYRYGFNGKENDNEVKGSGNQQDYGFRIYDPRVGRFLSVDPLAQSYPELTPYQFASNEPISNIDLDGLERSPAGKRGTFAIDGTAVEIYPNKIEVINKEKAEAPIKRVMDMASRRQPETLISGKSANIQRIMSNPDNIGARSVYGIVNGLNNAKEEYSQGNWVMGTVYTLDAFINTGTFLGIGPKLGSRGNVKVQTEFVPPVVKAQINSRHILSSKTIAKSGTLSEATLAPKSILSADLEAYNSGNFTRTDGGGVLVNGNSYWLKNEGRTLFPISGEGFMNVSAAQMKAINFFKTKSGEGLQKALDGAKISTADREFAQDFIKRY
jgi:RHS repeat-associated protein